MEERTGVITAGGKPVTLLGPALAIGDRAPDFEWLNTDMAPVRLADFSGKVVVLSSVPSLDTAVCDLQTRRFNDEAGKLGSDVVVLTLSMDLPFAQKRWCGALGVPRVVTLSDHREGAFGKAYGLLQKESRLLARAVLVVDREGVIRYVEVVPEISQEPAYDAALDAVRALMA